MPSKRPETEGPPQLYYNDVEAAKYSNNSRIIEVQEQLSKRALELLNLPDDDQPRLLLDIGCGSGLSGDCISEAGHEWIGLDISQSMLGIIDKYAVIANSLFKPNSRVVIESHVPQSLADVAVEREVDGDLILADMGAGIPFRPGTFDGIISISALQWLCNSDSSKHNPIKRFNMFFSTLYGCMAYGSRAVFQVYPENNAQLDLMTTQALRAGFGGGVVIDFPESTKAKKIFLVLFAGGAVNELPRALASPVREAEDMKDHVDFTSKTNKRYSRSKGKAPVKSRQWVIDKKERCRAKGQDTRPDSKYTGRPRKHF